jgi:hypothetical protein
MTSLGTVTTVPARATHTAKFHSHWKKLKKPWSALQTGVTSYCSCSTVFLFVFHIWIVPRRFLRGGWPSVLPLKESYISISWRIEVMYFITGRPGLTPGWKERAPAGRVSHSQGVPRCCKCSAYLLRRTVANHSYPGNAGFKIWLRIWRKMTHSNALFKTTHVSSGAAVRHFGIPAEGLLKSLRPFVTAGELLNGFP